MDNIKLYRMTVLNNGYFSDFHFLSFGKAFDVSKELTSYEFKKLLPSEYQLGDIQEIVELPIYNTIGIENFFPNFATELKNKLIEKFQTQINQLPKNMQSGCLVFTRDGIYEKFYSPTIIQDSVYSPLIRFIVEEERDDIIDIITNIPVSIDDLQLLKSKGIKNVYLVNVDKDRLTTITGVQLHQANIVTME